MKHICIILCFLLPLIAQDITYTNENIQVVDQIVPDEGIVENTDPFSFHGNWSSQFRYNNALGVGAGDSLKDEGFFHSHAFNFTLQAQLYRDVFLEVNTALRYDDQNNAAAQDVNLDNLLIRIFQPNLFEIQLGDISPRFSHYTLEQTLEGFLGSYNLNFHDGKALIFTAVVAQIPKDFRGGDQRDVLGYRIEALEMLPGLRMGIDQVFINDRDVEGDEQDISVVSFNGEWMLPYIPEFQVYWDLARSFNLQDSGANVPSQQDGYGIRSGFRYRGENSLSVQAEYEEVSPDFVSPVASAGVDRRAFQTSIGYALLSNLDIQGSYSYVQDNLYEQLEQTTRAHRTDWTLGYRPFDGTTNPYLSGLQLSQNVSFTKRFDGENVDTEITDFGSSANNSFGNVNFSLSYTLSLFRDKVGDDTDSNVQNFQSQIGYRGILLGGQFDTNIYMRWTDELFRRDRREHNITRVYGWRFRNSWQQYELGTNVEYQRLNRVGNNFEGEIYRFTADGRYSIPLKVGQITTSILFEYTINNFDLDEEEFEELRVLGTVNYSF